MIAMMAWAYRFLQRFGHLFGFHYPQKHRILSARINWRAAADTFSLPCSVCGLEILMVATPGPYKVGDVIPRLE